MQYPFTLAAIRAAKHLRSKSNYYGIYIASICCCSCFNNGAMGGEIRPKSARSFFSSDFPHIMRLLAYELERLTQFDRIGPCYNPLRCADRANMSAVCVFIRLGRMCRYCTCAWLAGFEKGKERKMAWQVLSSFRSTLLVARIPASHRRYSKTGHEFCALKNLIKPNQPTK